MSGIVFCTAAREMPVLTVCARDEEEVGRGRWVAVRMGGGENGWR